MRGAWRDAAARIVSDPLVIERARHALLAKYGWQARVLNILSRLSGRIRNRAWIEVDLR